MLSYNKTCTQNKKGRLNLKVQILLLINAGINRQQIHRVQYYTRITENKLGCQCTTKYFALLTHLTWLHPYNNVNLIAQPQVNTLCWSVALN